MPLDPAKVGLAVQSGLSIVCATCTRYWEGRDQHLAEPECTARKPCGSPLANDTFSEYSGPMSNFEEWCFRCGSKSSFLVTVANHVRRVGVCREHVEMFNQLRAQGAPDAPNPLLQRDGQVIRPQDLVRKRTIPKTLSAAIIEIEKGEL